MRVRSTSSLNLESHVSDSNDIIFLFWQNAFNALAMISEAVYYILSEICVKMMIKHDDVGIMNIIWHIYLYYPQ